MITTPRFILYLVIMGLTTQFNAQANFDLQGHRGCRGLMPENTLPAFLKAVELGVTTLEMDVVISKDLEIVVSHEPWMSPVICSHPNGTPVKKSEAKKLNLYKMNYNEIQQYDCGLRLNPKFPNQAKLKTVKPALKMVVRSVEGFAKEKMYTSPRYNIEIKSDTKGDNKFHPAPSVFVKLVVDEIRKLHIEEKTTLQSFDIRVLEELNKIADRKFAIAYLVEKGKVLDKNLDKLSFKPDIYSPKSSLVAKETVEEAHQHKIMIIPWTINDKAEMESLKSWGCDGGITDYPDAMLH